MIEFDAENIAQIVVIVTMAIFFIRQQGVINRMLELLKEVDEKIDDHKTEDIKAHTRLIEATNSLTQSISKLEGRLK